jgi:hypothetical protein
MILSLLEYKNDGDYSGGVIKKGTEKQCQDGGSTQPDLMRGGWLQSLALSGRQEKRKVLSTKNGSQRRKDGQVLLA